MHFQAFLLEGLVRWNGGHELAVVTLTDSLPQCTGRRLYPNFKGPKKYTGISLKYFFLNNYAPKRVHFSWADTYEMRIQLAVLDWVIPFI